MYIIKRIGSVFWRGAVALLPVVTVFGKSENTAHQTPASVHQFYLRHGAQQESPAIEDAGQRYARSLCEQAGYHCVAVPPGATWIDMWPDPHVRAILMRLNRTNVALRYRKWLLVPDSTKRVVEYMALSPFPLHQQAKGHRFVAVDLDRFAFGAYDASGDLVYWGPASGGRPYCEDTKEICYSAIGDFSIYRIQGENCISSKYPVSTGGGAPMPYCAHYYKGYALHGSTLNGFLHHSRGCVRLFYEDARWLNQKFIKIGTEVVVKQSQRAA